MKISFAFDKQLTNREVLIQNGEPEDEKGDVALEISQLGENSKLTEQIFTEPQAMDAVRAHRTDHSHATGNYTLQCFAS